MGYIDCWGWRAEYRFESVGTSTCVAPSMSDVLLDPERQ